MNDNILYKTVNEDKNKNNLLNKKNIKIMKINNTKNKIRKTLFNKELLIKNLTENKNINNFFSTPLNKSNITKINIYNKNNNTKIINNKSSNSRHMSQKETLNTFDGYNNEFNLSNINKISFI